MNNTLSKRYKDFIIKVSNARDWGNICNYISCGKNDVIIHFDTFPMVKKLIEENKLKPRKDYIYHSPDKTIAFDCKHIYGLLHIQMLNVIEHYLFKYDRELWEELCKNKFLVYFEIREYYQNMCYTYSFNKLKIDDGK